MANEAILSGDFNMLYIYVATPTAAYKPIACLTSNSLDLSRDFKERKTKCDPGKVGVSPGGLTTEVKFEGLFFDTTSVGGDTAKASGDALKALMVAGTLVTLKHQYMPGTTGIPADYYTAYISALTIAGNAQEDMTFSGTLKVLSSSATNPYPTAL